MTRLLQTATNGFVFWVLGMTVWAWVMPEHIGWFLTTEWELPVLGAQKGFVAPGLGVIMLGMGITLSFADFAAVAKQPKAVAVGVIAQFLIMPLLGYGIAKGFGLATPLAVGLILVSCCPGGTASNVIAYLSRGNLPLSVLMTMCSTLVAIVATPYLTKFLAGSYMPVDAWGLLKTTVQVVLLPVAVGVTLNQFAPKVVKWAKPVFPLVSVVVIALIVAGIIAVRKDDISEQAGVLIAAVFLLHTGGFSLGYLGGKLLGYDVSVRRTLSVEVGMQNSGLGAALAKKHFAAEPMAAVPSAISALLHCIIGSVLASWWRRGEKAEKLKS